MAVQRSASTLVDADGLERPLSPAVPSGVAADRAAALAAAQAAEDPGLSMTNDSLTGGVGTAFYRAPEQEEGRYDQKADLFSLGVIFLEILHEPFSTFMERAEVLTGYRNSGLLPTELEARVPPAASTILRQLRSHAPEDRPSAEALLSSPLLPSKMEVEQEYIREALKIIASPRNTGSFKKLVDSLFEQPRLDHSVNFLYDAPQLNATFGERRVADAPKFQVIVESLRSDFQRHNAVALAPPLLRPAREGLATTNSPHTPSPLHAHNLMDRGGVVVALPRDHSTSLARYVSHNSLSRLKR